MARETIEKFIKKMKYRENPDVLGVFFYGSAKEGRANKYSDIDLHVLTLCDKTYRGRVCLEGHIIEYFEKPLASILPALKKDFSVNRTTYVSMLAEAEIIFEKEDALSNLQKEILRQYAKYSIVLPSENKLTKEFFSISVNVERLEAMFETNSAFFESFYYTTLDDIRKFYQLKNGLTADIPRSRVYRIYTSEHKDKFKKLPDDIFIKHYLNAIENTSSRDEMLRNIRQIYKYVSQNIDIDINNCRFTEE